MPFVSLENDFWQVSGLINHAYLRLRYGRKVALRICSPLRFRCRLWSFKFSYDQEYKDDYNDQ